MAPAFGFPKRQPLVVAPPGPQEIERNAWQTWVASEAIALALIWFTNGDFCLAVGTPFAAAGR
jgi:hypothetical protein